MKRQVKFNPVHGAWFKAKGFPFYECAVICNDPDGSTHEMLVCYARVKKLQNASLRTREIQRAVEKLRIAYGLARLGVNPYGHGVQGNFGLSNFGRLTAVPVPVGAGEGERDMA